MKFRRKASTTRRRPRTAPQRRRHQRPGCRTGPFDVSDEVEGDGIDRVDLGSLLVPPIADRELRLQVDEQSGQVQAVMLAGSDGACEFQAFAAPRNGDLWSEVRPQIAADMARAAAQATEREGRWGTELVCQMPVQRPDGTTATQPSRVIGVNGDALDAARLLPRQPAVDPDDLRLGGRARPDRRTTRRPGDARRRAAAGRRCRTTPAGSA